MLRINRTILLFKVCDIMVLSMTKSDVILQSNLQETNNYLREVMKQSFEFWHGIYDDSLINCPLIWKKAIESNSEITEKITKAWKNNVNQNAEDQIQQFLELWSYTIRKSSFKIPMQDWEKFSKNMTEKQLMVYVQIIQMTKQYWKGIQDKNIE
jgi:hypothetical protein